ncbi:unnamed protein product [Effrenium voratum]|nr:unnamed protein product [Effrenium voratum]
MGKPPAGSGAAAVRRKPSATPTRFFDLAAAVAGVRMPEDAFPGLVPRKPLAPRDLSHPPRPGPISVKQAVVAGTKGSLSARCPTRTPSPTKTSEQAARRMESDMRKRSVSCAKAAIQSLQGPPAEFQDPSPTFGADPAAARVGEAWLRLARIALLELGTRGPVHPSVEPGAIRKAILDDSEQAAIDVDWRSPQVCLGYLLEQSVTWIEPESDDDFHSPKASVQNAEEEEETHPAMKAIARQQRAPGIVEGLPKCLSF